MPLDYSIGAKSSAGRVIKFIYGQCDEVIVFEDEDGRVQWESLNLATHHIEVHQTFDRLYARLHSAISERKHASLVAELAQALFRGLVEPTPTRALRHFEDVRARITQEALVRARIYYVGASTAALFVIASGLMATPFVATVDSALVLVGAAAGASGAWTSVLQRASRLQVGAFDPPHYHTFQGVTRTLLGGVFGAFLVAASNAGLVVSFARGNAWATAVAAFIAGISERYIPEMLREIEKPRGLRDEATTPSTS